MERLILNSIGLPRAIYASETWFYPNDYMYSNFYLRFLKQILELTYTYHAPNLEVLSQVNMRRLQGIVVERQLRSITRHIYACQMIDTSRGG